MDTGTLTGQKRRERQGTGEERWHSRRGSKATGDREEAGHRKVGKERVEGALRDQFWGREIGHSKRDRIKWDTEAGDEKETERGQGQ